MSTETTEAWYSGLDLRGWLEKFVQKVLYFVGKNIYIFQRFLGSYASLVCWSVPKNSIT